jgi:hypothetical protein
MQQHLSKSRAGRCVRAQKRRPRSRRARTSLPNKVSADGARVRVASRHLRLQHRWNGAQKLPHKDRVNGSWVIDYISTSLLPLSQAHYLLIN